jgi:antibiotic biosynthesis monooxygenase (ABM) superfamily enzyme
MCGSVDRRPSIQENDAGWPSRAAWSGEVGVVFAQVIRVRLKPDAWERFRSLDERWQREQAPIAPGFKGSYALREVNSPNSCIMVVLFENQELAQQNSDRPETNQWFQWLLELAEGEPEFIGTEVFRSYLT